jgi:hypothetical protein
MDIILLNSVPKFQTSSLSSFRHILYHKLPAGWNYQQQITKLHHSELIYISDVP